jgi:hypothetical protein
MVARLPCTAEAERWSGCCPCREQVQALAQGARDSQEHEHNDQQGQ